MISTLIALVFSTQTFAATPPVHQVSKVALPFATASDVAAAGPASSPSETLEVEVNFGFGFQLCAVRPIHPPLQTAFLCPGRYPTFETKKITLSSEKTSNPNWKLWSGPLNYTEQAFGVTFNIELLVAYADLGGGSTMAYIDGRIGNDQTSMKTYFRVSTPGGFKNFNHITQYGFPVVVKPKDTPFELSPHIIVTGEITP